MSAFHSILNAIERPTLLLDRTKATRNIERMVAKAQMSNVRLRPHFKTHQSHGVGEWFRERSVESITVSSVDMAGYFADAGWRDVTIAFTVNLRQLDRINELARRVQLNLLVESVEALDVLRERLRSDVAIWLKIDTGYRRTGIHWEDRAQVLALARAIQDTPRMALQGILTHAGNTYGAESKAAVLAINQQVLSRMQGLQDAMMRAGLPAAITVGDTPGCSLAASFDGVDEVRPGNFVFYDLMQMRIGACKFEDIAVAVACPVVAKHPSRGQIVIYGGAIHLSKEHLQEADGRISYGGVARPTSDGWGRLETNAYVSSLSQEHGIVQSDEALLHSVNVGDVLMVIPVHSCLTVNLFGSYLALDGELLKIARLL